MAMQAGDRVYVEKLGYGYLASPTTGGLGRYDWNVQLDGKGMYPAKEGELTLVEQVVVEGKVRVYYDDNDGLPIDVHINGESVLPHLGEDGEEVRITIERRKRTTGEVSKRDT
jgi:hypothetical protein